MRLPPFRRFSVLALALPAVALLMAAGCVGRRIVPNTAVTVASAIGAFVGNDACAKCHVQACRGFSETNHALTFREMTPSALGSLAPPAGPLPNTKCVLELSNDRYEVRVPSTGEKKTLDYALGSGKTGMTFISIENNTTLTEMRMSYFPSRHAWFVTPGQEAQASNATVIGKNHGNKRACILCHAVSIPVGSLRPDPRLMGVGCETCHGAARAHVEALTHGKFGPPMEKLAKANGDRVNSICGTCHRSVEEVFAMPAENQNSARFPVFGLASSRCFQASGGALTCISCHNPHENARKNADYYEALCLRCHSPSNSAGASVASAGGQAHATAVHVAGRPCPVNARDGCIACHMPKRKVFGVTAVPTTMADHMIKVYRKVKTAS